MVDFNYNREVSYSIDGKNYRKVNWPKCYPMPREDFKILDLQEGETYAIGRDNNGNHFVDVLFKSEFNNSYHWADIKEYPYNQELYPHLYNELKQSNYSDGGPSLEDLSIEELDKIDDILDESGDIDYDDENNKGWPTDY